MPKKYNNTVTVSYNVKKVCNTTSYKEMRDRVAERTGLSHGDIAAIFTPAYGEFQAWLEQRQAALAAYEETVLEQTLAVLNKQGPIAQLVAAANEARATSSAPEPSAVAPAKTNAERVTEKLKQYRDEHDLSYQALGRMLGVSVNTVWNWLKGKSTPNANNVSSLANWLLSQGYPVSGLR